MRYDTNYANRKKKEEGFAVKWEVGEDDDSSSAFVPLIRIMVTLKRLRYFAVRAENEP